MSEPLMDYSDLNASRLEVYLAEHLLARDRARGIRSSETFSLKANGRADRPCDRQSRLVLTEGPPFLLRISRRFSTGAEDDIASGDEGSTTFAAGNAIVSDPFNLKYDRGSGVLDRRHIFNVNYDYKLPIFERGGSMFPLEVLGGWELSCVTVAQANTPQDIFWNGADTLGLSGGTTNRPDLLAPTQRPKKQAKLFSTAGCPGCKTRLVHS